MLFFPCRCQHIVLSGSSCRFSSSAAPLGAASRGHQWLPVVPVQLSHLRQRKREGERAAASHTPAFALSSPPPFPLEGERHTLSANQSSTPPSPSHHLSFQGNWAPRAPSPSVSRLKGAASSSSSLPSVHPTVPF